MLECLWFSWFLSILGLILFALIVRVVRVRLWLVLCGLNTQVPLPARQGAKRIVLTRHGRGRPLVLFLDHKILSLKR